MFKSMDRLASLVHSWCKKTASFRLPGGCGPILRQKMDPKDDVHDEELYLKAVKVLKAKWLNILTL